MVVLLHGAKKNVGDYLIRARSLELLRFARPDLEIIDHLRFEPLDLRAANQPIVIGGGPALGSRFVPDVFRYEGSMSDMPPTYGLALGWGGQPVNSPESFRFNDESISMLKAMTEHGWISARDDLTCRLVKSAGIDDVRRTGCVAWYDVRSINLPVHRPDSIGSVVVTTPAHAKNAPDAVRLLRLVAKRFPDAKRSCVFHRGIISRHHSTPKQRTSNAAIAASAKFLGYDVIDAAYDLDQIAFYRTADLHVGYRVHAHLAFLSYRRPSILIAEDGRGTGQAEALNDPYAIYAGDEDVLGKVGTAMDAEVSTFEGTERAVNEIERTWPVMQEALTQITQQCG